tara:strand:+ start:915 stop:1715 length:801 start_codon:yes stop_codon:yes gene_type:complete
MSETEVSTEVSTEEQSSLLSVEQPEQSEDTTPDPVPHLAQDDSQPIESEFEWGDRPEFMEGLEQFWSDKEGPDLEGMAKSYTELRSKMSQGKHKAPKDGNYDMSSVEGIPSDDPLLSDFSNFAKDNGLSQDQFDQITSMYMQHVGEMFGQIETDVQAEMDKLGKNGDKIVKAVSQYIGKLSQSGVLNESETNALIEAASSADIVRAINKIREASGERSIPATDIQESGTTNLAELQSMLSDPRYGKDMHFTSQVERKFYEFHGESV